MRPKRNSILIGCLLVLLMSAATGYSETAFDLTEQKELAEGLVYSRYEWKDEEEKPKEYLTLLMLELDSGANPELTVRTAVADGRILHSRKKTSEFCEQEAERMQVLASVNADFFDMTAGGPLGWTMQDGNWLTTGEFPESCAFIWRRDGTACIENPKSELKMKIYRNDIIVAEEKIDALNALRGDLYVSQSTPNNAYEGRCDNHIVLYTPKFSETTCTENGGVEVRISADDTVILSNQAVIGTVSEIIQTEKDEMPEDIPFLYSHPIQDGNGMKIGENEMVLSGTGNGARVLSKLQAGDRVEISCSVNEWAREAETITGGGRPDGGPMLVRNGEKTELHPERVDDGIYFYGANRRTAVGIRADGTCFFAVLDGTGVTIAQWQDIMLQFGAVDALNLDGGPSSTFVLYEEGAFVPQTSQSLLSAYETRVGNVLLIGIRK